MPKTLFVCMHYEKYVEQDSFNKGCIPITRRCVISRTVTVTGESMKDLVKNLSLELCLDCEKESWWIPMDDGEVSFMSFDRLENDDGDKPTTKQDTEWKAGELDLWLADYTFHIEKRVVSPVSPEDLQGVKFHE